MPGKTSGTGVANGVVGEPLGKPSIKASLKAVKLSAQACTSAWSGTAEATAAASFRMLAASSAVMPHWPTRAATPAEKLLNQVTSASSVRGMKGLDMALGGVEGGFCGGFWTEGAVPRRNGATRLHSLPRKKSRI